MRIGDLYHRVSFYRRVQTKDEGAGVSTSYELVKGAWANVKPMSSSRIAFMRQVGLRATHSITIRYDPEIDSSMAIEYDGRWFSIEGIENPDENNTELRITASETGADSKENL